MSFSPEEITATFTGILYVWFAVKEKPVCWIFGIVSAAASILIAVYARYYMDIFINGYYILAGIYGLYLWTSKKSRKSPSVKISVLKPLRFGLSILATCILSLPIGYLFYCYTDNSLPYLDAAVTTFAALATLMTAGKILQNWTLWIVIDVIWMLMYIYKEFYILSLLFAVYTAMSFLGYFQWKKQFKLQNAAS